MPNQHQMITSPFYTCHRHEYISPVKTRNFSILSVFENGFCYLKNGAPLFYLSWHTVIQCCTYPAARLQKVWDCHWNYSTRGHQSFC